MRNYCRARQPSAGLKPKEYLKHCEVLTVEIRKRLKALRAGGWFSRTGAAKDDAEAMADCIKAFSIIEKLAVHGQKCSAEEAIEIVEIVEALSLTFSYELDALLASGNRQVG